MRLQAVLAATLMGFSPAAFAICAMDDHRKEAIEGGVVVEVEDADYELVARPDTLQLFVRGHRNQIDLLGLHARVALIRGKSKQVVVLRPVFDRLEATGSFQVGPGTKAVAVVTRPAKPSTTVRFTLK